MKVITISGHARHGKDLTANTMSSILEKDGHKVLVTHYADLLKYICKMFFGWDGVKDENGRSLLQYVGTDVVRNKEPDFWVGFIIKILNLFHENWDYVLIPDTRFPNEIESLIKSGFDVMHVRVIRPDFDNGLTEEQRNHPSETALDDVKPDVILENVGSYDDFVLSVETLIKECIYEAG